MSSRRSALLVCLLAGFTTLLDSAVLTVAVPTLRDSLDASTSEVQWLLASYSLTFGLALVPAGRLGDLFGRRVLFLAGVAVFALGGMLAGTASTAIVVIVARLLQGVGGGVISSQVLGIIQDLFPGAERGRALGAYGVASGLAGVSGPLLGGLILLVFPPEWSWRLVLLTGVPFALVTVVTGLRLLPRSARGSRMPRAGGIRTAGAARVDVVGLTLLAIVTLGILLPFVWRDAGPAATAGLVLAAVLALALFVLWERWYGERGTGAIVSARLARSPGFVIGTLVSTFWFGSQLAQSVVITLYLLDGVGLPPLVAGAIGIPSSLAMAGVSAVSWRVVRRFGQRVVTLALAAQLATLLAVALVLPLLEAAPTIAVLLVSSLLGGVASGFIDSPNRAIALQSTPDDHRGVAAGFLQLAQRLSATVCIAAVTGIVLGAEGVHVQPAGLVSALLVCSGLLGISVLLALWNGTRLRRSGQTSS